MALPVPLPQQFGWVRHTVGESPQTSGDGFNMRGGLASPKRDGAKGVSEVMFMIKECIIAKSWLVDGVSRQVLKTWISEAYGVENDAVLAKNVGIALKAGLQKGVFEFPRGLNGKVKLAKPPKVAVVEARAALPKEEKPRMVLADKANVLQRQQPVQKQNGDVKPVVHVKVEEKNHVVKEEEEAKGVLRKAAKEADTPRKSGLFKPPNGDKENIKPVLIKGVAVNIMRQSPLKPSPVIHYRDPAPLVPKRLNPAPAVPSPLKEPAVPQPEAEQKLHSPQVPIPSPIRHIKRVAAPVKRPYKPAAKTISKMHLRKIVPAPVKVSLCAGMVVPSNTPYTLQRRLGSGSFGDVWQATRWSPSLQQNITLAVKVEFMDTNDSLLNVEGGVYKAIQGMIGVPKLEFQAVAFGYRFLGMTMLGGSFEDELRRENYRMNIKTVINFATQMLTRLEGLHDRGYLHRDLKPENILLHERTCWLVDFGFAKRYCHPKTGEHIPARNGKGALGTPRYASLNVHLGRESARRDDLESLSYILVYLINGRLPWQGLAEKSEKIWDEVHRVKQSTPIAQVCGFAQAEFRDFISYCRGLEFTERPDYSRWRKTFRDLSARLFPTTAFAFAAPSRPGGAK
ncbi:hypothetical protein FRB93_001605 [Tulasnella sp. JGI-2019a]|nr:hypothetical protein FRB93_001605 [Tulasnella sp. JGI-2019a]